MAASTTRTRRALVLLLMLSSVLLTLTHAGLHAPRLVVSHLQCAPSSSSSSLSSSGSSRRRGKASVSWYGGVRGGGSTAIAAARRRNVVAAAGLVGDEKKDKDADTNNKKEEEQDTTTSGSGYWGQFFARNSNGKGGNDGGGGTNTNAGGAPSPPEDDFFEDMREYFKSLTPSPPAKEGSDKDSSPPSSSSATPPTPPDNSTTSGSISSTTNLPATTKKGEEIKALDRVLTGVTATAVAFPGLLKVKAALVAKVLWRVASYRFPVAIGAYVCAAVIARFVVGRIQALWTKRPVRDMYLDTADRDYQRYGVILQREAHEYFKFLPAASSSASEGLPSSMAATNPESSPELKLLTAALELPCLLTRRDEYVDQLAKALTELVNAQPGSLLALAEGKDAPRTLQSLAVVDQGRAILCMRLGDATARLARDALLGSARRVQAAHRYWDARYKPRRGWKRRQKAAKRAAAYAAYSGFGGWFGGKSQDASADVTNDEEKEEDEEVVVDLEGIVPPRKLTDSQGRRDEEEDALSEAADGVGGSEGISDPSTRREAHRVAELDARLKDHQDRIGALEAHLLARPENVRMRPVGESLRWAFMAVALAEEAVEEVGRPLLHTEALLLDAEPSRENVLQAAGSMVKKGVGGAWSQVSRRFKQQQQQHWKGGEEVIEEEDENQKAKAKKEEEKAKASEPLPRTNVTWRDVGLRANNTLVHALGLRARVAKHLDEHDLDRPKMSEWLSLSLRGGAYVLFLRSLAELWSHREAINNYAALTKKNTEEFLVYRFLDPGRAILEDLILNKRQRLTDMGAITDAQASLRRMLSDFIDDTYPQMSKVDRAKALEAMDISLVSEQYDKEIRNAVRNVFSGKIVRMLLIQMQYVKKELLVAMEAIDDLFNANKVNLQLFAVIPALFLTYGLYRVVIYLIGALASRRISNTSGVHGSLRRTLRDIERLLILAPRLPPSLLPSTFPLAIPPTQILGPRAAVLDERRLGELVLLAAEFQSTLRVNAPRLEVGVRKALEEDMSDLLGGPGRQTVEQQLTMLNRIRRGYGFLQSRTSGGGGGAALFELLT